MANMPTVTERDWRDERPRTEFITLPFISAVISRAKRALYNYRLA